VEATPEARRAVAARFTATDLLDLQVLHKLAWIDPLYHDQDLRVQRLVGKGRGFDEEDKAVLRAVELELLNRVIPEYRDAAARGQTELSTSPFYHPILPLLCDSHIYLATHPESPMPRHRFRRPEDAAEQLSRAVSYAERLFGSPPAGLWPSEGSVSDAVVPLVASAGLSWMATDELVLARTLNVSFSRDADGHLNQPELLYAPRRIRVGNAAVTCAFRDHVLSDLIGFTYASWPADAAAEDFCSRLAEAGRRYAARTGGEEATIPIILDGENAWEHFPDGGRPFLRALYGRLSKTPELQTVTMAEACRGARHELRGIFPGSWIDANFYIWMGHAEDHAAWSQLAEARDLLDTAAGVDPGRLAQAREEVFIAEGSDWFWWYGDDHSSEHDAEFDDLFRRHLRNVYQLLGRPVPDDLFVSNITVPPAAAVFTQPTAFLNPVIDGDAATYFEWLGAGALAGHEAAGAMHQAEASSHEIGAVYFGFDAERLFVRIDGTRSMLDILADGREVSLKFVEPPGLRFSIRAVAGRLAAGFTGPEPGEVPPTTSRGAQAAAGSVVELALPLGEVGVRGGSRVAFVVVLSDVSGVERERHPARQPIELRVPDGAFEARNWSA
jgi:alpha-amylase/alpha-mannosidase (GH57 family)